MLMFGGSQFFHNFIISSLGLMELPALAQIKFVILCRSTICIVPYPSAHI